MPKQKAPSLKKEKLIGEVTHYFSQAKVAVIKLSFALKKGETIRIKGGQETDFTQEVKSMEIENQKIEKAKKGISVGLKIKKKARPGYKVYRL